MQAHSSLCGWDDSKHSDVRWMSSLDVAISCRLWVKTVGAELWYVLETSLKHWLKATKSDSNTGRRAEMHVSINLMQRNHDLLCWPPDYIALSNTVKTLFYFFHHNLPRIVFLQFLAKELRDCEIINKIRGNTIIPAGGAVYTYLLRWSH